MPRNPNAPKKDGEEYRFKIDAYSPAKIPMLRLAEYMGQLAQILGQTTQVHFKKLAPGSTVIVSKVETEAAPKVGTRVAQVKSGDAPQDALRAYQAVNKMLRDDNATGILRGASRVILPFPGKDAIKEQFESVRQHGFVDGVVTGVRGRDDTAHIILMIEDRQVSGFTATRVIAKQLATKWDEPVRLFGRGKWKRDDEGNWTLEDFRVESFEPLDDSPLTDALAMLREIPAEWGDNAYSNLDEIRHGPRGKRNGGH